MPAPMRIRTLACAGLEVHNGKLVVYGCGDLVNDYEGFDNPGDDLYNQLVARAHDPDTQFAHTGVRNTSR